MFAKLKAALKSASNFVAHTEPVAVAHAVSAVAALAVSVKAGHLDYGVAIAAWLAVQAVLVRHNVSPVK